MVQTHLHAHDHAHGGHDHADHIHAGHAKGQAGIGSAARHARAASPTVSLLRLSAAERMVGAGVVVAALWGLVAWAMS
jgi:hypothetical protein